jgi:hypothetical protein
VLRVESYEARGLNKRELIEKNALKGEWLFGNRYAHIVAFHLCYTFGGDWASYNDLWNVILGAMEDSDMRFDPYKRVIKSFVREDLAEGMNLVDNREAWESCLREERKRAENDKRIKRPPEERCLEKLEHVYWVRAKPELCWLLYKKMASKPGVLHVPPPPVLEGSSDGGARDPGSGPPLVSPERAPKAAPPRPGSRLAPALPASGGTK